MLAYTTARTVARSAVHVTSARLRLRAPPREFTHAFTRAWSKSLTAGASHEREADVIGGTARTRAPPGPWQALNVRSPG
jgi:hypothetical protein